MPFRIAVIAGEGMGREVIAEGLRVREAVTAVTGTPLDLVSYDVGAERYLQTGEILPDAVFAELQAADAIYLGAVGDPRVQNPQYAAGLLLRLRFELDLWVNLRPSRLLAPGLTPLRDAVSIDLVVVRENTEGAYVGIGGQFKRGTPDEIAIQEDVNTRKGVERIVHYAFGLSRQRRAVGHRCRLTMVDKSNALYHAHDLWQRVFALVRQGAQGRTRGWGGGGVIAPPPGPGGVPGPHPRRLMPCSSDWRELGHRAPPKHDPAPSS